jgi:hypothetical protein
MSMNDPSDLRRARPAPPARLRGAARPWRLGALAALLGGLLLLLPGVAVAGQYVDQAVAGLRDQPVYVDQGAKTVLKKATVDYLRNEAPMVGAGMYVAVLPAAALDETGGSPDRFLAQLPRGVRKEGVYALVAGGEFRAGGTGKSGFSPGEVPALATEAARSHPDDLDATVKDFTGRARAAAAQGQAGGGTPAAGGEGGGATPAAQDQGSRGGVGAGTILLGLLAVGAVGGGALLLRSNRRRREQERHELEQVKQVAQEDLIALGEDIRSLDIDVQMPGAAEEAPKQHAAAVAAYEQAAAALDRARSPADLAPVSAALEEGRFAMASAKALLEGKPLPERRPPCFFDPRHGPSVRDVTWAPPGGEPRQVPACAADALRIERGEEPDTRRVQVGDRSEPFYNAPGYYAPWYGGYFGGFGGGGLLTGLLLGSALGGGFGGWGWGGYGAGYDAGYQAGGDQGDFGGGDFGDGGDFGGGDFGGGDFGGGDFGGGGDF